MTGLKRMVGLPVMLNGEEAGYVLRGVLTTDGRALRGLVMRGNIKGARWLPKESITLLGDVAVIAAKKPSRCPKDATYRLFKVSDTLGTRLGVVTDALIDEESMRVKALQISSGPVDDLTMGRWYALHYSVTNSGNTGHVTISDDHLN